MYCEACGVPLGITRGNMWHADGSINGRFPPYIKGTFFDVDELNHLFRSLSDLMDYDIGDIVASGKYIDARDYMTATVEKMKEGGGGLPSDEDLYRMMLYPVSIWGIADVKFKSIEPDRMVIEVKDPYSTDLLRGDVTAVADVVSGRENAAVWEGDEHAGVMTVVPGEGFAGKSGLIEESSRDVAGPAAGELACEHCERCGAPRGVSRLFEWRQGGCRIEERFSGRRYCFNNTQGITAVLRMLAGQLGEDIERKMVEVTRGHARSLYGGIAGKPEGNGGHGGMDLAAHLESFPYRGWGKVTDPSEPEGARAICVENPYNDVLLTGRLWGMLEASGGLDLRIAARETDATSLRLAFSPV
ncbi:MAG: hypothetical protein AB1384_10210 [Actinomycetota bacterium]